MTIDLVLKWHPFVGSWVTNIGLLDGSKVSPRIRSKNRVSGNIDFSKGDKVCRWVNFLEYITFGIALLIYLKKSEGEIVLPTSNSIEVWWGELILTSLLKLVIWYSDFYQVHGVSFQRRGLVAHLKCHSMVFVHH